MNSTNHSTKSSTGKTVPTLSALIKNINLFVQKYGLLHLDVFSHLLDYIISRFRWDDDMVEWPYSTEQTSVFQNLFQDYLLLMQKELQDRDYYDAFGNLFMELIGNFKGYRGQFFTPESLCDVMSVCLGQVGRNKCGAFGEREIISDMACGSGRTLLSAHCRRIDEGGQAPYLMASDLDILCCKMTAINLCMHGCFGEVVCRDSLKGPQSFRFGYIINEGLYPFPGMPTIRTVRRPTAFLTFRTQNLSNL